MGLLDFTGVGLAKGLLGGKTSKSTQTSSSQNRATTTPNVPDWLLDPAKQLAGNLGGLAGQDPSTMAPRASWLQDHSWGKALSAGPSYLHGEGANTARQADTSFDPGKVQGQSLLDGLQDYYDPFQKDVIDTTLGDFDEEAGRVRASQSANAAKNQSFRGTRFALREAETEDQLARGRAKTAADLRSAGFDRATRLSSEDAARRQAALEGNAGRSLSAQTAGTQAQLQQGGLLANIGASIDQGDLARNSMLADMGRDATNIDTANRTFPLTYQKELSGIFSGLNPSLFTGQTVDASGSSVSTGKNTQKDPMGDAAKMAQVAAMFFSDRRLKRDVVKVGERADGLGLYLYRYLWSPILHLGVMAQEVLKVKPEAAHRHESGFWMVDYGRL